jgi:putative membrane protein
MSVWILKLVHIATISIWIGGLLAIPFLLAQRQGLEDLALDRLHRLTRFLHVAVASPAAVVAVASGIALVFLRETWVGWFSVKLLLVGLLAGMHRFIGSRVRSTFEPDARRRRMLGAELTIGTVALSGSILWIVLSKPDLQSLLGAGGFFAPGALGTLLTPVAEPVTDAVTQ